MEESDLCQSIITASRSFSAPHLFPSATGEWLYLSSPLQRDAEKTNEIVFGITLWSLGWMRTVWIQAIIIMSGRVYFSCTCSESQGPCIYHVYILSFRFSSQKWSDEHVFLSLTLVSPILFSWQNFTVINVAADFLKTLGRKDFAQYNFPRQL